ncbi:MAG: DUF3472 domain-containing protein [Saprospiraceae bacterium]|nr:DUF3472 domain-containing protein [Saprospiraceae bacterium]
MKITTIVLTFINVIFLYSCFTNVNSEIENKRAPASSFVVSIPTAGNSWVMNNDKFISSDIITRDGIRNWNDPNHTIRTYFYLEQPGTISLSIRSRVHIGASKIKIAFNDKSKFITLSKNENQETFIADFKIDEPGYYYLDIKGIEKDGEVYADVDGVLINGMSPGNIKYVKDDFYFGRRGPSVHLRFEVPEDIDQVEWFYSELTIPKNQDVIGSYFMANGFGEGYFGIQVNSPSERRILFSIWSPFKTDNPNEVPEDHRIKLLKKGEGVTSGKFGNEGSGGQSYKVFNWKSDVTYGFLVGAKPTGDNHTDYIAYFHDPELNEWNLIAQFRRPKTSTHLTRLYSFLENFIPDQGVHERRGLYHNQWVYSNETWHELNDITFTVDNTAKKEYRLDYSGGLEKDGFYLKNCGFTNDLVTMNSKFKRENLGVKPDIDFSLLK